MNQVNLNPIWDRDLTHSVESITKDASALKKSIFKTVIMGDRVNQKEVRSFETAVNEFVKKWADHATELQTALKGVSTVKNYQGLTTIDYNYVKGFIYAKYDYASVLQFTDGIIKGISDGKFKTPDQIENFKDHSTSMAFGNNDPTVPGLVDSVITSESSLTGRQQVSTLDIKTFETVRNYKEMFDRSDRIELQKSIKAVIDYMMEDKIVPKQGVSGVLTSVDVGANKMRIFTSMVNNIVEYILYSLAAYASRIFIIYQYCNPFIRAYNNQAEAPKAFSESMSDLNGTTILDVTEDPNGSISSVFQITDETIIKDPKKYKEFFDRFEEFTKMIGVDFGTDNAPNVRQNYSDYRLIKSNKICQKLSDNPLYCFLVNREVYYGGKLFSDEEVAEMHQNLRMYMHNNYHGLSGYTTPRHEILHIIRGTEYEDTVKGYKDLAKDLYTFAIILNCGMRTIMDECNRHFEEEINDNNKLAIGTRKLIGESSHFIIGFYEEVMFAIAEKIRFIERKTNELRDDDIKKVFDNTSINIKGMKSDTSLTHYTSSSVPSTIRIPISDLDVYALPAFEELSMHYEYLQSLPEFADDLYFSEAGMGDAIATIMAKIRANLKAFMQRLRNFVKGKAFKRAQQWVVENEQRLRQMNFSNVQIQGKPYVPVIQPGFNADKLASEIGNINVDEALKKNPTEYIKDVYNSVCDKTVADIFTNDSVDNKNIRYKNLVLFHKDSDREIGPETITDVADKILNEKSGWIQNIKTADQSMAQFENMDRKITAAVESFNSKITAATNRAQTTSQTQSNTQTQTQGQSNQNEQSPNPENPAANVGELCVRIQRLIDNLWGPIIMWEIDVLLAHYNYIKNAYAEAQASGNNATASNQKQDSGI